MYDGTYWVWLSRAQDNNDNNAVTQSASSSTKWRKILLHSTQDNACNSAVATDTNGIFGAVRASIQPNTGIIYNGGLLPNIITGTGTDRKSVV